MKNFLLIGWIMKMSCSTFLDGICGMCDHILNNYTKNTYWELNSSCPFTGVIADLTCCLPCTLVCCTYGLCRYCLCCAHTLWSPRYAPVIVSNRSADMEIVNYDECKCRWSRCGMGPDRDVME